jgi:hypothetical protein
LIAEIGFPLQFKQISNGMCNFLHQPIAGSLVPLQITELVSSEKCSKIISHECEWVFHYQFFAADSQWR